MSAIYKNGKYYGVGGGGGSADTEIIADDFDPTESYAVGEYVVYEGTLYKCTTAHTGDWDASNFEDTQVMAEMPTPMPAADMGDIVSPLPGVMSRRHKYSTTEQVVGTWIDGKPVYQKVINNETATTISVSSWTAIPNAPSNIDNIISIDMLYSIQSTRSCFPLLATLDNGVVKAKPSGNTNYGGNVFVFRYTKTTD